MSMNYGSRRDRPRVRLLNEETDAEKYKRLGWDPRKTYEENMGYEGVFDRPDDALDWPDVAPQRRKPTRQVRELAAEGRGNDTEIAHVANGEYVIPREFLTPELLTALRRSAAAHGVPLERLIVGNARNQINPNTGAPEFWFNPYKGSGWLDDGDIAPRPTEILLEEPSVGSAGLASGLPGPNADQPSFPSIQVPGAKLYEPPSPGIGTMPMPTEPRPDYKPPSDPGTGTMPLPSEPHLPPQTENWPTQYGDTVTGQYGFREKYKDIHRGVDFQNERGDPVYTVTDGRVEHIGTDPNARGGSYVIVRDSSGNLYGYAHSGVTDGIKVGSPVQAGQQIGVSNGSGRTPDGQTVKPHLHMTFRAATPEFAATMRTPYSDPNDIFRHLRITSTR